MLFFKASGPATMSCYPTTPYYNVYLLMERIFVPWGLHHSRVDMADPTTVKNALRPNTKLVWAETPSNPQLKLTDITALAHIATRAVPNWPSTTPGPRPSSPAPSIWVPTSSCTPPPNISAATAICSAAAWC